jgi:hypothetical protein
MKKIRQVSFFFFNIAFPDAPWCRNVYLQNWVIFEVNVGKYSSTMEHMGLTWINMD